VDHRPVEAFLLANEIQQILADDPEYQQLRQEMTVAASFHVKPDGTTISYRDGPNPEGTWVSAGKTPLNDVELPRGDLRFRYSSDGYVAHEFQRKFPEFLKYDGGATMSLRRLPETDDGMVEISGVTAAPWNRLPTNLSPFSIDRYEVSNAEYQQFVDDGGYTQEKHWSNIEFELSGQPLAWEEAMKRFLDSTGRPGPAFWKEGRFPEGQDDFPVVGVSWYEAVAYAAYRKKSLPTVHHWRWAADTDQPGLMSALSNFSGQGPSSRGTWDGIGRFEVYDLAGNVKEWCLNEGKTVDRCLCGGAWDESEYKFRFTDFASPWLRKATIGFRCVKYASETPEKLTMAPLPPLAPELNKLQRQTIETLTDRGLRFANNEVPFDAKVTQTDAPDPSPHFRHEVVRITAGYDDERFDVHLFLPREGEPPFETVVWSPGMGVWARAEKFPSALEAQDNQYIAPLLKSGRIVCQPIYMGTFERSNGIPVTKQFQEDPIQARADFIKIVKDTSRTVDYLMTRADVDPDRLVYFGLSMSAMQGPIRLVAVPEFDAAVLLAGGFHASLSQLPEIHGYQYAPHVKIPVLMINGENDNLFDFETAQKPMFDEFLNDRSVHDIIKGAGHNPPPEKVFEIMDPWLDSVFHTEDETADPEAEKVD
jgi:formylglycine-generating enzyme required for sulfatase activity/dienelactone hydrolase